MKCAEKRKESEITYQAEQALKQAKISPIPGYVIERYRSARLWRFFPKEYMFRYLKDMNNKEILDFGCGDGLISIQMAKLGARVTGIDISPEMIELAKKKADVNSVWDRVEFMAGDVTRSPLLRENTFDYVICHAVMHHVDIGETMPFLQSSLKPGGIAIISEPTGFSPFLRKIRDMVPVEKNVSPGERQLNRKDMDLISGFFGDSHMTFFGFLGRLQRLFPNANKIDKGHIFTKLILVSIYMLDRLLITLFPFLWRYYGSVVIVAKK